MDIQTRTQTNNDDVHMIISQTKTQSIGIAMVKVTL